MEQSNKSSEAKTINLENDYEKQYWTTQLKVTNDDLREAVKAVGNSVVEIKVYLNIA